MSLVDEFYAEKFGLNGLQKLIMRVDERGEIEQSHFF